MARRDHFYDPEAPKPNSIRPATAVALIDSGGNILLLRRKDNDKHVFLMSLSIFLHFRRSRIARTPENFSWRSFQESAAKAAELNSAVTRIAEL